MCSPESIICTLKLSSFSVTPLICLPSAVTTVTLSYSSGNSLVASVNPQASRRLGALIAVGCTLATVLGYALADVTGGYLQAAIDGFAAGALLVMLVDSMIPEATSKAGRVKEVAVAEGASVEAGRLLVVIE